MLASVQVQRQVHYVAEIEDEVTIDVAERRWRSILSAGRAVECASTGTGRIVQVVAPWRTRRARLPPFAEQRSSSSISLVSRVSRVRLCSAHATCTNHVLNGGCSRPLGGGARRANRVLLHAIFAKRLNQHVYVRNARARGTHVGGKKRNSAAVLSESLRVTSDANAI